MAGAFGNLGNSYSIRYNLRRATYKECSGLLSGDKYVYAGFNG